MTSTTGFLATMQRLLTRHGALGRVTIRRDTTGVEDPVAGEITGSTLVDTPLFSTTIPLRDVLIDGERIKATDIAFIADNAFKSLVSDSVIIDTREYKIVAIMPLNSNGVDIVYEVVCRG